MLNYESRKNQEKENLEIELQELIRKIKNPCK